MVNHIHVILRNRPDIVAGWSDEEVARRWWKLFPLRKIFRRFGIVSIQSPKPWLLDASVYPIHRSPCKRSVPMSILGGLGWKSVLRTTHKPVEMGDVNFG